MPPLPPPQDHQQQPNPGLGGRDRVPAAALSNRLVKKLVVLATLGFCALVLGAAVLTLQLRVTNEIQRNGVSTVYDKHNRRSGRKNADDDDDEVYSDIDEDDMGYDDDKKRLSKKLDELASSSTLKSTTTTTKSSFPTQSWDIRLWSNDYPPREPTSVKSSADAYWMQALSFLLSWDGYLFPDLGGQYTTQDWSVPHWSEYGSNSAYPRLALEKAAKAGHPMAQYYLGNAMASGVWPVPSGSSSGLDNQRQVLESHLEVFDEIIPHQHHDKSSPTNHPQVTKSYLLWHMAAMAGNVDAAMTLAYRMEHYQSVGGDGDFSGGSSQMMTCEDSLPYYEAAAHGIMDELETSMHSRAKVIPAMDKHILAQVHMHGGTSSQLDWHNKPDESVDALQYYHLKATTVPWTVTQQLLGGDGDEDAEEKERRKRARKQTRKSETMDVAGIDVSAAYTLGHLYHYGYRGVDQNLTKALEYYEIAGSAGHWESSGHACLFYLWGMGMEEQDIDEALVYCRLGAPMGIDGCRAQHEKIISSSSSDDGSQRPAECDDNALNGLGLLYLLGIKGTMDVDVVVAEKYFALAKELGNTDAHYNLAMMWLGWKTHFKHISELTEDGVSDADGMIFGDGPKLPLPQAQKKEKGKGQGSGSKSDRFVLHLSKLGNNDVFKGPIQDDVTNAIKLLTVAANKGHVQAKHRLAMIYTDGLQLQTNALKYESVKKDCSKAKGLYNWIVDNASPSRARRLKTAYKEYIAGNMERSLRNYLTVAETGSSVGQVNAAFLLERGTCLGMNSSDCAKASVRMWKAAAARGSSEACLRVGDFYYYGRMRGDGRPRMPFAWIQYVLYPEKYMPDVLLEIATKAKTAIRKYLQLEEPKESEEEPKKAIPDTCEWNGEGENTCPNIDADEDLAKTNDEIDSDLAMAAHYYTVAVEKHSSGRANFNLGFMHEWGLGLTQDFPLAKRHYDLAAAANPIAVQVALWFLSRHETFLRWKSSFINYLNGVEPLPAVDDKSQPGKIEPTSDLTPPPPPKKQSHRKTKAKTANEVIMSHLFNASSLLIVILILIVIQLFTIIMQSRQRRR